MPLFFDQKSNAGTEQMARRLQAALPPDILSQFDICAAKTATRSAESLPRILWLQDLPNDPQVQAMLRIPWDRVVFVSHWQQQAFLPQVPWDKGRVLLNAIEPMPKHDKPAGANVVFFGVPRKGLDLAVKTFLRVAPQYPAARLHVHSSFDLYGYPKGDDELWLKSHPEVAQALQAHPQIVNHGYTPPAEMRLALRQYHVLLYPSTWRETSCLSLIEAMSAGLVCIHPDLGALPETSGGTTMMYHWSPGEATHCERAAVNLRVALDKFTSDGPSALANMRKFQKDWADVVYSWNLRKMDWVTMLTELLEEKKCAQQS
jgi:UDP-glucose:(glucosyl)LPS alpha-1,2-glucosyltransferase